MTESESGSTEERIAQLEARLTQVEDQLALYQSVSAYGPAVDSLQSKIAAELWTEEGVYDIGDPQFDAAGRDEIQALFDADYHRGLVASGCAHTMTLPHIKIAGDRAIGLGYHRLFTQDSGGYQLFRLSVSRWEWVRPTKAGNHSPSAPSVKRRWQWAGAVGSDPCRYGGHVGRYLSCYWPSSPWPCAPGAPPKDGCRR